MIVVVSWGLVVRFCSDENAYDSRVLESSRVSGSRLADSSLKAAIIC